MGTRVVFEIMCEHDGAARPAVILFANASHPVIDPLVIFETIVDNAQSRTQVLAQMMGRIYVEPGGVHRAGDPIFNIVDDPYGDYEFIMRLNVDGSVERIEARA